MFKTNPVVTLAIGLGALLMVSSACVSTGEHHQVGVATQSTPSDAVIHVRGVT